MFALQPLCDLHQHYPHHHHHHYQLIIFTITICESYDDFIPEGRYPVKKWFLFQALSERGPLPEFFGTVSRSAIKWVIQGVPEKRHAIKELKDPL